MTASSAIEFLSELKLSWSDLESLTDDQKAAIAIACLAVSEVNALKRVYAFCEHNLLEDSVIDYSIIIQIETVLRTWSAKLFEFSEFIKFQGKDNKTTDEVLLAISRRNIISFEKFLDDSGYRVARFLRHEVSNHYNLRPVKRNLDFVSTRANCSFFVHKSRWNSFFPMGSEVVFAARIYRETGPNGTNDLNLKVYDEWWHWNIAATNWLHSVHLELYKELIVPIVKKKNIKFRRRDHWIRPSLVGVVGAIKIPIFLRVEK